MIPDLIGKGKHVRRVPANAIDDLSCAIHAEIRQGESFGSIG